MTDVARRQARSQKHRLDTALLERRRREALAELGEILYQLVSSGEIELDELPELGQAVQDIAEIDRRIAEAGEADRLQGESRRPVRLGRTRSARADWRPEGGRERVWRPDPDAYTESGSLWDARDGAGTGEDRPHAERITERARPVRSRQPAPTEKDARRRPPPADTKPARGKRSEKPAPPPPDSSRGDAGGGIVFVDDDSAPPDVDPDDGLEAYMNEDDVPRRR